MTDEQLDSIRVTYQALSLLFFYATDNRLTKVPDLWFTETSLIELNLNSNELTVLDLNTFADFPSLQNLYLSANNIHTVVPFVNVDAVSLKVIALAKNALETFPEYCMPRFDAIPSPGFILYILDNPIPCFCNIQWLHTCPYSLNYTIPTALLPQCE